MASPQAYAFVEAGFFREIPALHVIDLSFMKRRDFRLGLLEHWDALVRIFPER